MRKLPILTVLLLAPAALAAQPVVEEAPPAAIAAKVGEATRFAEAGGAGPFKAEMASPANLQTHTVYRPRNLAAATRRGRLPIVVWGNGACANYGNRFRYFLTEIASQGYLVVAVGPIGPHTVEWKVQLTDANAPPPAQRPPQSFAFQLTDAIDWAVAENQRKGSSFYHRLDPSAIAVMGQSCGGLQAISAAADRRVTTAMIFNSGTFAEGSAPLGGTGDAIKASLRRIHVPVAWISGDDSDVAHKNADADYAAFVTAPALRAWHKGTGHSEHFRDAHGGLFEPFAIQWLDWKLKHRQTAVATFVGRDCGLCRADGWVVESKGLR